MSLTRKQFLMTLGTGVFAAGLPRSGSPSPKLGQALAEARKLRISDVEIFRFDLPLDQPFRISIGTMNAANDVLVRVKTDAGLAGVGEACPFPPITGETQETNLSMAKSIREMIVGKDPLAIEAILKEIGTILHTNPSIVAAYDMALLDILGKAAGLPLFRLLGGDRTSLETDITAGLDTPENMARRCRGFIEEGYRIIKIKVGQEPALDVARLEAVREAVGPGIPLRIDANQGWTTPQAITALRRMEKIGIEFVEQPVAAWDLAGMWAVRAESPIAVMADESLFLPADALKLVKAEACDYFNIKLMKSGGITNSLKISHVAESANIRCMVGCMLESRVALTAAAHLAAARSNIIFADLDGNSEHKVDPVIGGIGVKGGTITLPEKPGLGLDVDPAFLEKMGRV
ncbi:MAG: dipeptide epimerase [Acidobacteriota bacterium]|nr:dipeptide epimerase [Acidobacteriota bacterium]